MVYLYKDKENRRASPGWMLVLNLEFFFLSNKSKGDRLTVPQIGKQNETNQPKCICGWYHNCMATDYSK